MTRVVILAAGLGSRLMPLTRSCPKGMVPLMGQPLLVRQIATLRANGIFDITLVGGHQAEQLAPLGLPVMLNAQYDTTNMVASLMCARHLLDGNADLIMVYGDIVYEARVLVTLLQQNGEVVVTADQHWETLWQARMTDYASDVETFRLRTDGSVAELGRRPKNLAEVQAQYIGLVKFPAACHSKLLAFYDALDRNACYDGQPFSKMYMTSFIQQLINDGWQVRPALIQGGWLEIDTLEDLHRYEHMASSGALDALCALSPCPALTGKAEPGEPIAAPDDVCDIRTLTREVSSASTLDARLAAQLDAIARKIEIVGVLFCQYSLADMKPRENVGLATPEQASALLVAFVYAFDLTGDYRHLNTVLKALDGSLHTPRLANLTELGDDCRARLQ